MIDNVHDFVNQEPEVIELIRDYSLSNEFQTVGMLRYGKWSCKTLELPWKDNQYRISCIPKGVYYVTKRQSPKYGNHLMINRVEGRDMILIHSGNYNTDTKGCILVGDKHIDINNDGQLDVTNSRATLTHLISLLPQSFIIDIS